ncbi:MAG: PAS domain S-box protein [Salinivirgaceae bacterium]
MIGHDKTYEELSKELHELQQQYDSIKAAYEKEIAGAKVKAAFLKKSENRYRSLIDLAVDGILLGSHEGVIIDDNESMCSIVGIAKNDLIGKHISQVPFTPESLAKSPFRFDLLQKGEIVINDRVLKRPDGIEVTVEMRTKMMPDGTYQSIYRDITERKMNEAKLRKSEQMLQTVLDNFPGVVFWKDRHSNYLGCNHTFALGAGLNSSTEIVGKTDFDCPWSETEAEKYRTDDCEVIENGKPKLHVVEMQHQNNGKVVWFDTSKIPLRDSQGQVIGIIGVSIDITDQKKAETEILKEKHFNEKLLDSLPVIFYLYDKDLRLRKWNKKHVDELGYSPEELQGFPVENWHQLEEAKALVRKSINHVIENNTFISIEATLYHKNGQGIPYLLTGVRFDSPEGPMLMGIGVNITDLKNAENELIKAKEKAEESDRLKTAFLQNMSHEIRTPMNAIMGFSELIVDYYNDKPKLEKFSEIINQRSNDLLDIINDILDIAKIESVQLAINEEACNLNELFAELTAFFAEYQKRTGKQHIEFSLKTQCNLLESSIATDKVKLKQIFINLISNAFKFTDSGSIVGGCKLDNIHNIMFYVTDTGIGIPQDKQQFIFERFTQLNPGDNKLVSGTGLGLSIVKGLVILLGGEIFVESEVGKGTTFSFTIPYKTIQPINYNPIVIEKTAEPQFSGITILIVEDDKRNAEYLMEILTSARFKVVQTQYGNEAVKIANSGKFDLVLMDVRLPDIDGYEATRQIRMNKPNMKIIAQTAYASHQEKQKALDSGCNDYISKPIKKELLLLMISRLLQ